MILSYDEAHLLRDSANQRQYPLSALLAAVARAQREPIPIMLVVCGLPPLTDNLALAKSYSERMFQAEVLDALRPPEDQHAFERPLSESHRDFDPELIEAVRGDARGYPFHIQFVPPWKRRVIRVGCNNPPTACRSRSRKLRAAWPWKRKVRVGAALTTTGRTGTTRRTGPGKQDGKAYECRNQWWNPLKGGPSSNLVDMGWSTARASTSEAEETTSDPCGIGKDEGHGECLRRNRGEAVGKSWTPPPSTGTR